MAVAVFHWPSCRRTFANWSDKKAKIGKNQETFGIMVFIFLQLFVRMACCFTCSVSNLSKRCCFLMASATNSSSPSNNPTIHPRSHSCQGTVIFRRLASMISSVSVFLGKNSAIMARSTEDADNGEICCGNMFTNKTKHALEFTKMHNMTYMKLQQGTESAYSLESCNLLVLSPARERLHVHAAANESSTKETYVLVTLPCLLDGALLLSNLSSTL